MTTHLASIAKIGRGVVAAGALLLTVGCGGSDGLKRLPIYGQIAGAEGRQGSITLIPQGGLEAPAATVPVVDGAYRFDKTNGPIPGDYEAIVALDGGGAAEPPTTVDEAEQGPGDKVVQITSHQGRAYVSFDVQVEEKRTSLSVADGDSLEVNITLP